jgi:hypothetical protein
MSALRICAALLLCGLGCVSLPVSRAWAAAPTADQVKAVFVFNFSHFVEWPPDAFASPTQPFVIGVLGGTGLATQLEEAVRGESVDGHPLQVRRFGSVEELGDCQILFIAESQAGRLEEVLARLNRRGTLTVSDLPGASRRGVMIQLANERSRIRLLINVDEAQAAGLTISSNLLRPAEIVRTGS